MDNRGRITDRADPLRSLSQGVTGGASQVLRQTLPECARPAHDADARGQRGSDGSDGQPIRPLDLTWRCEHCDKPIPAGKRIDTIYCSRTCQKAVYSALEKAGRLDDKRNRPPCQHCGKAIPAEEPAHRIFCSRHCQRRGIYHRNKAARQRICVICNAPYLAVREDQQTCGWQCGSEYKREKEPRPCKHCGAAMERPLPEKKFCDKRCQDRWHKARRRAMG